MFTKTGSPVPVTVTNTMDPEVVNESVTGVFLQKNHDNSRPLLPRIQKIKTITGKPEHSIEELSQLWGDPTQMSKDESSKIGELSSLFGDSTEVTISPPMTGAGPISRSGYEPLNIKHVIQDEMRPTLVEPPELPKLPVIYTEAQPIPRGYEDRLTPESLQTGIDDTGEIGMMTQSSMVRDASQNLEQSIIAKNKEIKVTEKSNAEHSDLIPSDEIPSRPLKYTARDINLERKEYWGKHLDRLKNSPRYQELYNLYEKGTYDMIQDLYKVAEREWKDLKAVEDAVILPPVNIGKLPIKDMYLSSTPLEQIDAEYLVEERTHPKTIDGVVSITKEEALNMVDELFGNSTVLDMVEGSEVNPGNLSNLLIPLDTVSDEEVARFDTQIQESIGGIGTASIEEILTSKIFDPLSIETVASSTNQMVTDLIIQPFLQATPPTLPMSLNVYQYLAGRTANRGLTPTTSLMVAALGLTGEAGEVADIVKKVAGHGHALDGALRVKLQKEIGDVMWYIAELCTQLDITMEETAYENVQKLKARYPEGFSSYRSINRVE